jgi:hypothetical protein
MPRSVASPGLPGHLLSRRAASHALVLLVLALATPGALAQSTPIAAAETEAAPGSEQVAVPAGTTLVLELVNGLSSRTSRRGDRVELRLADALRWQGRLLVPAGTIAVGEVVHADRAKGGGQAGELVFAARYLLWDGRELPLRATQAGVGDNRTQSALGLAVVAGVAGFLVRGGEIEVAPGALFSTKLRDPVLLAPIDDPEASGASSVSPTTTGEHQE